MRVSFSQRNKESKLRVMYTVYLGSNDKPVVQEWIGFRNGDDCYIGQNKYFRSKSKRVLRWSDGAKTFDTAELALASLKPVRGYGLSWRHGITPALVIKCGDGRLRATDKNGHSLGDGYLTKKAAAKVSLKAALEVQKRTYKEHTDALLAVTKLRKILAAR